MRLLAIDFGHRRCGIAVTDPSAIVAGPLATVAPGELIPYLRAYIAANPVERIIVGLPTDLQGRPSESMRYIDPGVGRLRQAFPAIPITMWDERFTSTLAHGAMLQGGLPRQRRRDKALVDRLSATIILNSYLESRH